MARPERSVFLFHRGTALEAMTHCAERLAVNLYFVDLWVIPRREKVRVAGADHQDPRSVSSVIYGLCPQKEY